MIPGLQTRTLLQTWRITIIRSHPYNYTYLLTGWIIQNMDTGLINFFLWCVRENFWLTKVKGKKFFNSYQELLPHIFQRWIELLKAIKDDKIQKIYFKLMSCSMPCNVLVKTRCSSMEYHSVLNEHSFQRGHFCQYILLP